MGAAERIIEVVSDLAPQDRLRLVVDSGDEDPIMKLERIERGLAAGDLPLGVPRQVSGYWFAAHDRIPADVPEWLPTGAMLPRSGEQLGDGGVLLLLVPIEYVWFPLSERGLYTYGHSSGLSRGEEWRFVPRELEGNPWPTPYLTGALDPLAPDEVAKLYGSEAAQRARLDARALQVRVHRA